MRLQISQQRPRVIIVIPCYRRPDLAVALGASLSSADAPFVSQMVFVEDSDSGAALRHALESSVPPVSWRVLELGCNRGFAAAANVGMNFAAEADPTAYIFLVNSDVVLHSGVIGHLLARLEAERSAYAVPRMLQPNGLIDGDGDVIGRDGASRRLARGWRPSEAGTKRHAVTHPTGGAVLMPAAVWRDVGPFDERLRMYYEDVDWGLRAFARGWRGFCHPEATLIHHGHGTAGREAAVVSSYANYLRVLATRLPRSFLLHNAIPILRGVLVGAVYASSQTSARHTIRTWTQIMLESKDLFSRRKEVVWTPAAAAELCAVIARSTTGRDG